MTYFFVKMTEATPGFRATLQCHTDQLGPDRVDGVYPSSPRGVSDVLYTTRNKWGRSREEAIDHLWKEGDRQVKKLSTTGDLRPSQVRRLELLRSFLESDTTLLDRGE